MHKEIVDKIWQILKLSLPVPADAMSMTGA